MAAIAGGPLDILICEHDPRLRSALAQTFRLQGDRVAPVADGGVAVERATSYPFDVVLLGIALGPHSIDGFEVCRRLRARLELGAIIMLSKAKSEADVVVGLEAGADDYLTWPFRPGEMRSRIRAVLRRTRPVAGADRLLRVGHLVLDQASDDVRVGDQPVTLTRAERAVLRALMSRPGDVLDRHALMRAVQRHGAPRGSPRTIDVHIRHLRQKLERESGPQELIRTVRSVGYQISEPPTP